MIHHQQLTTMKQRLDAAFERIDTISSDNLELRADYARYLCVLVSGYIETSISYIIREHASRNGSLTLQKYIGKRMEKFTNANPQKIIDLLGSFNDEWQMEITKYFHNDDRKTAINTIISNRHRIAHGQSSHITIHEIRSYYEEAQKVVAKTQTLCLNGG